MANHYGLFTVLNILILLSLFGFGSITPHDYGFFYALSFSTVSMINGAGCLVQLGVSLKRSKLHERLHAWLLTWGIVALIDLAFFIKGTTSFFYRLVWINVGIVVIQVFLLLFFRKKRMV